MGKRMFKSDAALFAVADVFGIDTTKARVKIDDDFVKHKANEIFGDIDVSKLQREIITTI